MAESKGLKSPTLCHTLQICTFSDEVTVPLATLLCLHSLCTLFLRMPAACLDSLAGQLESVRIMLHEQSIGLALTVFGTADFRWLRVCNDSCCQFAPCCWYSCSSEASYNWHTAQQQ